MEEAGRGPQRQRADPLPGALDLDIAGRTVATAAGSALTGPLLRECMGVEPTTERKAPRQRF